jgi:hypothetical protein
VGLPAPQRMVRDCRSTMESSQLTMDLTGILTIRQEGLAPNRGEPRLPLSRQTGRPVVMMQMDETGRNHVVVPRL